MSMKGGAFRKLMEWDLGYFWVAKKRCVAFWVKLLQMRSDRLIKVIAEEVLERGDKVKWVMDLWKTLKEMGWEKVGQAEVGSMSSWEIEQMISLQLL